MAPTLLDPMEDMLPPEEAMVAEPLWPDMMLMMSAVARTSTSPLEELADSPEEINFSKSAVCFFFFFFLAFFVFDFFFFFFYTNYKKGKNLQFFSFSVRPRENDTYQIISYSFSFFIFHFFLFFFDDYFVLFLFF